MKRKICRFKDIVLLDKEDKTMVWEENTYVSYTLGGAFVSCFKGPILPKSYNHVFLLRVERERERER